MTGRSFGGPYPRGLPGENEGLWYHEPRGKLFEHRTAAERLRFAWEEVWVEPPSTSRVRDRIFEDMERHESMPRKVHSRGAFVVAPPRAGSSMFLQETARRYRLTSTKRIALAAMPHSLKLRDFLVAIRAAIGHETYEGERTDDVERSLHAELERSDLAAIAVDDLEHLVHATPRARRDMLLWLRHVGRRADVYMILATPPVLLEDISASYNGSIPADDPFDFFKRQRPFQDFHLRPFRIDAEYLDLLDLWERRLPLLHASHLAGRELALHLYALCDGRHGRLAQVLRRAAAEAITSGRERITIRLLDDIGLYPVPTFSGFRF